MLFQSGYLTIKEFNAITESYMLGVPDEEVRRDLTPLQRMKNGRKKKLKIPPCGAGAGCDILSDRCPRKGGVDP